MKILYAKKRREGRRFTESFAFTLGLAVIIVYFAGILSGGRAEPVKYENGDAVAVFAEADGAMTDGGEERNLWDVLDECFESAFTREDGR